MANTCIDLTSLTSNWDAGCDVAALISHGSQRVLGL